MWATRDLERKGLNERGRNEVGWNYNQQVTGSNSRSNSKLGWTAEPWDSAALPCMTPLRVPCQHY